MHFFPAQLSRWPANPVETTAQMNDYVCTPWHASPGSAPFCVTGDATEAPSTLLWGDSHALQLVPGFAAVLKRAGPGMVIATKDACPPVTGLDRVGNSLVRYRLPHGQ